VKKLEFGGDEFIILLGNTSRERVNQLGDSLREQFQLLTSGSYATPAAVTLSIGASLFDQPPSGLTALIEQGDKALYETKRAGRNSISLVDLTLGTPAVD